MASGINPIGSLPGKVDSNNQLVVAVGSGSVLPSDVNVDAGSGTADAGIGGVLTVSTTSAQTGADTNETDLWTYSLPANTLSANGYVVRIRAWGTFGATSNNKTVKLYFGSTVAVTSITAAFNNISWFVDATVIRTGASAQVSIGHFMPQNSNFVVTSGAPAEAATGAITIKVTGQNATAAANDVVFKAAMVEFLRAGS